MEDAGVVMDGLRTKGVRVTDLSSNELAKVTNYRRRFVRQRKAPLAENVPGP